MSLHAPLWFFSLIAFVIVIVPQILMVTSFSWDEIMQSKGLNMHNDMFSGSNVGFTFTSIMLSTLFLLLRDIFAFHSIHFSGMRRAGGVALLYIAMMYLLLPMMMYSVSSEFLFVFLPWGENSEWALLPISVQALISYFYYTKIMGSSGAMETVKSFNFRYMILNHLALDMIIKLILQFKTT